MTISGKEIFCCEDHEGLIQVFDDGNKRYLAFGNNDEQSCILKNAPYHLQYDYTRAMILPLVFETTCPPENTHILLLGLGAGSLANCLLRQADHHHIIAIELRQAVIDVAYQYFQLPRHSRLTVLKADANNYIANDQQQYRLIFSDIYSANGMDNAQIEPHYLGHCLRLLSADGWLVLNFWREHRSNDALLDFLKLHCQQIWIVTTKSGNWVVLATKQNQDSTPKQRLSKAKQLSRQLGFSLIASLKKLQPANY